MLLRIEHGDATLTWPPRLSEPDYAPPPDGSPLRLAPGHTWRAAYDALGRRLWTQLGPHRREFYWDGDRLAAEIFPDGQLRIYQHASSTALVPLAFIDYERVDANPTSGKTYHVFSDPVGMPLCIEDDEGRVVWWARRVDPYGLIDVRPDARIEYNLRWPGHYFDPETGLHYNRHRYYDPKLGRYLQCDPTGYAGSPVNLYAYCKNPLSHVDVLGLHDTEDAPPPKPADGQPTKSGTEDPAAAPAPETPPKRRGTVTVTDEAKAFGDKSPAEAKKLAELTETANQLANRGHDVVVHGEGVTGRAGELEIIPGGTGQPILAESKRLDSDSPRAVQTAVSKGTAQAGDGGTVVIDGTGSGTTPETFDSGMGTFERTSAAKRKEGGKPGSTGDVIFLHGEDGETHRSF